MKAYGASAPAPLLYKKFGFTPENVATQAEKVIDFYAKRGGKVYSPLARAL
jgi:transketolase